MSTVSSRIGQRLSHDAYFQREQQDDCRYEYLAGELFAMAGGSESHALISMNTGTTLSLSLRGRPCRVYGSDMKLRIDVLDKFCYPDLMVLCEQGRRNVRAVEAPTLIVEVLSKGTEAYDRGLKFEHYRTIPELRAYLLIAQERPYAELFERGGTSNWTLTEHSGMEGAIELADLGIRLAMGEIYRDVLFAPEPE